MNLEYWGKVSACEFVSVCAYVWVYKCACAYVWVCACMSAWVFFTTDFITEYLDKWNINELYFW